MRACACRARACASASQVVSRQGADAVSVRLGAVAGAAQAQLEGFRSRALRVEATPQRHLYVTEWRLALKVVKSVGGAAMLVVSDEVVPAAGERGWAAAALT